MYIYIHTYTLCMRVSASRCVMWWYRRVLCHAASQRSVSWVCQAWAVIDTPMTTHTRLFYLLCMHELCDPNVILSTYYPPKQSLERVSKDERHRNHVCAAVCLFNGSELKGWQALLPSCIEASAFNYRRAVGVVDRDLRLPDAAPAARKAPAAAERFADVYFSSVEIQVRNHLRKLSCCLCHR